MRLATAALAAALLFAASSAHAQTPPLATPSPALTRAMAPTEPRSSAMMIGGIFLAGVGAAATQGAALVPALLPPCNGSSSCTSPRPIAGGLLLGGVVLIAAGVPLLVLGAQRVPVRASAEAPWLIRF